LAAETSPTSEGTVTTTTPSETPSEEPAKTTTTTTTAPPSTTTPASATTPSSTAPDGSPSKADSEIAAPPKPTAKAPAVVLQRKQKTTRSKHANSTATQPTTPATGPAAGANNNVAAAPQLVAAQAGALAAELAGSAASTQALAFYRIPLFLLPIYQSAAVQYGVPWQILAAINEIETNYGTDVSVSTAGAVGWMQFMPATWIQYGVDALNSGYADPYNPVDAIFAAARYLRAAGAASDLNRAILAYNHSDEYVKSVLLRARLISSYPRNVVATLTGLTDDGLPVTGKQFAWGSLSSVATSSATAGAAAVKPKPAAQLSAPTSASPATAPTPTAAAATASGMRQKSAPPLQLVDLMSAPGAKAVAVQDGRIVKLGSNSKLGKYVILRDVYGDVFTYAGLGSIATHYNKAKASASAPSSGAPAAGATAQPTEPKPKLPATEGRQPVTLKVKAHAPRSAAHGRASSRAGGHSASSRVDGSAPVATGKMRLFAHPGNPDALASAARSRKRAGSPSTNAGHPLALKAGAIVSKGTVLGRMRTPPGAHHGHMRFAIRPGGDQSTIDPRPILQNWSQLDAALHPRGTKGTSDLLGATASGVFLLSQSELERTVLSDPGITISACGRHDIASGGVDKRVLAALAFLSRSGLKPTVTALRCSRGGATVSGTSKRATVDALDISAINGMPIANHQGAGTITDLTIRALLTLRGEFVPNQIISLMQYPGAANTLARAQLWDRIHVGFRPSAAGLAPSAAPATKAAHSAGAAKTAPAPIVVTTDLSTTQWNQLITRVGALPVPKVPVKPSSSAIKARKRP
jgi:membrane-bound lytic murein transglycosylase B